ncbi:MAG: DNA topoisomerase (ATP-hydrolyzing) subunit B [Succinivibrionaceae bacterium]
MTEQNSYTGESIKVLKGLDAVRKRPGMYIGDTDDGSGLHHMVFEVVDNSIDEALAGYCDRIDVVIHNDGSIESSDDGRGIPVDIHPEEGVSAAEVVMTVLHAGGKFDQNSYKVSGGLHGVGVSVVNALSDKLLLRIKRDGKLWEQVYVEGGHPIAPLKCIEQTDGTGTSIRFWPSPSIFSNIDFNFSILQKRLRELSFLNSGVNIFLKDERDGKCENYHYQGGIQSFIEYLNKGKNPLFPKIFYCSQELNDDGIKVEVALQYNDGYAESEYCYTNNIPQKDGGTHRDGFRRGLTQSIKKYIEENNLLKKEKVEILTEDCRKGLTVIVSVKVPDPKFSSQTKDKLVSSEVSSAVSSVVSDKFFEFLNENPNEAKLIVTKIIDEAKIRVQARSIRETFKKKTIASITGKLVNCISKNPVECELYIVEGDSAGGSAKGGRNAVNQAILPLRGKILNVEKTRFDKIISSETIGTLITALGCGIQEDYNPENFRYHNIVIMTDADVDGAHIRILLLTFFFRQMPDIIERGYVYIAQPPLYKYEKDKQVRYILGENEKNEYETSLALHNAYLFVNKDTPPIYGENLEKIFNQYASLFSIYKRLDRKIPSFVTKELVLVKRMNVDSLNNKEFVDNWSKELLSRLKKKELSGLKFDVLVENSEDCFYIIVCINHFGVTKDYVLDREFFLSSDYIKISKVSDNIFDLLEDSSYVQIGDQKFDISDFEELYNTLIQNGLKGVKITRFKGLGEMNKEQLYETTMNPDTRTFLRVTIDDAIEADRMFTELMGEEVDPRKIFIADNSHLAEIDV